VVAEQGAAAVGCTCPLSMLSMLSSRPCASHAEPKQLPAEMQRRAERPCPDGMPTLQSPSSCRWLNCMLIDTEAYYSMLFPVTSASYSTDRV
jgi:hypothetical protein